MIIFCFRGEIDFFALRRCFFKITNIGPLIRRGLACYFLLIESNQRSSHQRGFFAARAFALQSVSTLGLQYFCPASLALGLRFSKNLLCPSSRTAQHVLPDSPEAYLLTNFHPLHHHMINSLSSIERVVERSKDRVSHLRSPPPP